MSVITWPAGLRARHFQLVLASVERSHQSPFGGSEQVVDLLNDRWTASLELPASRRTRGGLAEGFIASLRGQTNVVNLWHMARPVPQGTMRGAPTLSGEHAQGVGSLSLVGAGAGATLKMGDLLGVGSLLVMVAADCIASGGGAITVPIANRLRHLVSNGTLVIWDRPSVPFRKVNRAGVSYEPGVANSVQLDFVEYIA